MPSTDLVLGQMLPGTTGQTSANFCRLLPPALPAGGLLSTALVEYQNKPLYKLVGGDGLEPRHPALETAARRGWAPAAPLRP
jgi:hypothetical protein